MKEAALAAGEDAGENPYHMWEVFMAERGKYVAYVSTYTMGDNHGISIYDVDLENGRFSLKDRVEITNSSYLTISHNRKWLYSITDFGVEAYEILRTEAWERLRKRFSTAGSAALQSAISGPTSAA